MKFETHSHRHALNILKEPQYKDQWDELIGIIEGISDSDIIHQFPISTNKMSISAAINDLLKKRFVDKGWKEEAPIFQDPEYNDKKDMKRWRLDFAKEDISIEVAFNHGEAIAWNLLKPAMASELNHVKKEIQTKIGVIISATESMKKAGGFDVAVKSDNKWAWTPVWSNNCMFAKLTSSSE